MPRAQSCRYVEVSRAKAKPATNHNYWPLAAGTIVLMLAIAVVNHSGWTGHRSPVMTFAVDCKHMDDRSRAFQPQYQAAIGEVVRKWRSNDNAQNLQTLHRQIMRLGHFKSARVSIAAPQSITISALTGERLFDVDPSFLAESIAPTNFQVSGFVPLPSESKALSLPVLDVSTSNGFSTAIDVFEHARAQGWSAFIEQIREPQPNQIELVVSDASGTQGLVDFRSTPAHEAGTEPLFALKLKILDKQAMVYQSLTPGGGHWRIEPRGMVRRPAA